MKKLFYAASIALIAMMGACGQKGAEQATQDSAVETTSQATQATVDSVAAAQTQADSQRQDSIKMYDEFVAAIPSANEIDKATHSGKTAIEKLFKAHGFTVSTTTISVPADDVSDPPRKMKMPVATLEMGDYYCKYKPADEATWEITIKGAPELLKKLKSECSAIAKKWNSGGDEDAPKAEANLKGNTLMMYYPE